MKRKLMTWSERLAMLSIASFLVFLISYPFLHEPTVNKQAQAAAIVNFLLDIYSKYSIL